MFSHLFANILLSSVLIRWSSSKSCLHGQVLLCQSFCLHKLGKSEATVKIVYKILHWVRQVDESSWKYRISQRSKTKYFSERKSVSCVGNMAWSNCDNARLQQKWSSSKRFTKLLANERDIHLRTKCWLLRNTDSIQNNACLRLGERFHKIPQLSQAASIPVR